MGGVVVISADLIVAVATLLATFGGGLRWLVTRMDRKIGQLEKRYASLRAAFQMVSMELARKDPTNPVLHEAQLLLLTDTVASD
jgi:hypothetical protein